MDIPALFFLALHRDAAHKRHGYRHVRLCGISLFTSQWGPASPQRDALSTGKADRRPPGFKMKTLNPEGTTHTPEMAPNSSSPGHDLRYPLHQTKDNSLKSTHIHTHACTFKHSSHNLSLQGPSGTHPMSLPRRPSRRCRGKPDTSWIPEAIHGSLGTADKAK